MMHEAEAYRRLWGNVLMVAIKDALTARTITTYSGNAGTTHLEQQRAQSWFGSKDFHVVCLAAGFDPEFVMSHVGPLLDAPAEERRAFLRRMFGNVDRGPTRLQAAAAKYREAA